MEMDLSPPNSPVEGCEMETEPDSMELLMSSVVIPDSTAGFCTSVCPGFCSENEDETEMFCPEGYVRSGELHRIIHGQTPTPHLAVRIQFYFEVSQCNYDAKFLNVFYHFRVMRSDYSV